MNLELIVDQQRRLANTAGMASRAAAGITAPWIQPPENFEGFDPVTAIATPLLGSGETEVLQFKVPFGWEGVIKGLIHNYIGGGYPQGSGGLIWRLLIDGRAVRNYDAMLVEFGSVQEPRPISGIRISSNQLVQYMVNVAGGGGWVPSQQTQIVCGISGWMYPRSVA